MKMPCVEETPKNIDVALQILDVVTPRINVSGEMNSGVVREITQTDHLNRRLLKTFLDRLNISTEFPEYNSVEEDEISQDFDD